MVCGGIFKQKLEKIDAYLSDVIDEELEERNDRL